MSHRQEGRPACRILYVVGQLVPGGAERQLCYLLQSIDRGRYEPAVFVWNYRSHDVLVSVVRSLGIPIFFPNVTGRFPKLQFLRKLVKGMQPEVVHSYSFFTNFAAWYASLGTSALPVGSMRQDFVTERREAGIVLGRLSAHWPSVQIANSLNARRSAETFPWFSRPSRIEVVRNGLDLTRFSCQPIPEQTPSLLAAGRLSPEKRWDRLLTCVSALASSGLSFTVNLAGDGPLRAKLEADAKSLVAKGLIKLLGARQDIPELLVGSNFLVHTADAEGSPNIIMEAMASGRAVVATDSGDVPYLVDNGKTGFVVKRDDNEALIEAIARLITDPALCNRMGLAGRAKAEREFGLERLASETLGVYRAAEWKQMDRCEY
jgi:glycosyltransferase involved in cell wall biosynthesis